MTSTTSQGVIFCIVACIGFFISPARGQGDEKVVMHIGGIFPMKGGTWNGGEGCLPAAKMALDDVNNRTDILPGYHLKMFWNDSECNPGIGTNIFYKLLYDKPQMIMLLSGCSSVSTPVAEAARLWNLIVVSYGSSSPALSNRERFPTFFRTHPSATLHNPARIKLCQEFHWNRIAVLQETQEVFTSTIEDLEMRAKQANIEIVSRQSFLTDPDNAVGDLLREDARIIVGVFYVGMARKVFCEVYKKKLYGPKIVWFLIGWYPDNWYAQYDPHINCTADELKTALENHFTTEGMMLSPDPTPSISGMNAEEFKKRMSVALGNKNPSVVSGYPESPLSYDAVWAIALALNKTSNKLAELGLNLESYTYGNKQVAEEIYMALNSSRFKGLSGTVAFSSTGDRLATMQIERMINGTYQKVAYYDIDQDNLTWVNSRATWPEGKTPKDGVQESTEYQFISKKLYIPVCLLCSLVIIFAFTFLIFNILFSHTQYLECSQAGVNNIMVLGCLLCLTCVFLFGLDGQYLEKSMVQVPKICQSTAWLLSIGFSLGYGALFGKIWMVHQLITKEKNVKDDKTKRRKVSIEIVPTWKIYTLIGVKVLIDIVILIVWQSMDPVTLKPKSFGTKQDIEKDENINEVLEMCESDSLKVWLGTLYAINGLLLLFGIFLAYETRNMAVRDINDSKYVAMAIYNVVVLCIITAPVTSIIRTQPNAVFGFVSFSIIICCAITLGVIFVPKILYLTNNPSGDYNKAYLQHLPSKEDTEKQIKLTSENEGIKRQIAEKEERIRRLTDVIEQKLKERSSVDVDDRNPINSTSSSLLVQGKISPGRISFEDSAFISTYTNSGAVVANIGVKINAPHGSDEEFSETYL